MNDNKTLSNFLENNPLAFVMIIALLIRLISLIFSKGFIHSDDHFDSIAVAHDWLISGFWGEDGYLRWKHKLSDTIGRFPLYALIQYAVMRLYELVGIKSLNSVMYGIRMLHLLISLLPVWAGFKIVKLITKSNRYALFAGLILALHFAFPFLAMRNLIEVVGGNIWVVALYFLIRWEHKDIDKKQSLLLAGIFSGLAWMFRFQIAFAIIPIPLLLWWISRKLSPSVYYSIGVGIMLLLSGFADLFLLGKFAGSTITNLTMNTGLGALYNTIPLLYPAILLLMLIPPLSLFLFYIILRPSFWLKEKLLVFSSLIFVIVHSLLANQQERFIFPILPAVMIIALIALWYRKEKLGYIFKNKINSYLMFGSAVLINFILLIFFTTAYGHKGMVEPLVWLEKKIPTGKVLVLQPEVKRWLPIEYGGRDIKILQIRSWDSWQSFKDRTVGDQSFDYFILYPKKSDDLNTYQDSLTSYFGQIKLVAHEKPSAYDNLLHNLNRNHNDNFDAYIFEPVIN